jgi:hypothetical protein
MRINLTSLRHALGLVLAGALFGLAPAGAAQDFVTTVGDPIAWRVDLPADGEREEDGDGMVSVMTDDAFVMVGAMDLMEQEEEGLPVSDEEARRIMTSVFMGSDSLLIGLMAQSMAEQGLELDEMETEIRTLGGERAAYLRGVYRGEGDTGWLEMYLTVKDGIIYMLLVGTLGEDVAALDALGARIHGSFALPDAS